jgi:NAD+ diphosphatase
MPSLFDGPPDASRLNGFSSNPLDRRSETRGDPGVLAAALADVRAATLLFSADRIVLDPSQSRPSLFDLPRARRLGADMHEAILLGWMPDGSPRFAVALPTEPPADDQLTLTDLRSLALSGEADDATVGPAAQGRSMLAWHARHGFCANCGRATSIALGGYRRDCPHCEAQHFPRVDPVSIMLVTDGERALLGRQPRFRPGSYSCLAGFVEPGETLEDAVRRETFEEAGIRVGRVRYHSSQPWPFPSSLMIGCLAEADTIDIVIDRTELEDCRWFPRDEVRAMMSGTHPDGLFLPPKMAIARMLIETWVGG